MNDVVSVREGSQIDFLTHSQMDVMGVEGFGSGRYRFKIDFFSRSNH